MGKHGGLLLAVLAAALLALPPARAQEQALSPVVFADDVGDGVFFVGLAADMALGDFDSPTAVANLTLLPQTVAGDFSVSVRPWPWRDRVSRPSFVRHQLPYALLRAPSPPSLSIYPSIYMSISLSIYLSISISLYLSVSIYFYLFLSISQSLSHTLSLTHSLAHSLTHTLARTKTTLLPHRVRRATRRPSPTSTRRRRP